MKIILSRSFLGPVLGVLLFAAAPTSALAATNYEAESALKSGTGVFESSNTGFSGTGYMNFGLTGSVLTFSNVAGNGGGTKSLDIRYANGGATARVGNLTVNGATRPITFAPTGSWISWQTLKVNVALNNSSANTIVFASTGSDLGNIDYINIFPAPGNSTRWEPVKGNGGPQAREECAFVEVKGRFYLLGGRGIRQVDIFDPKTGNWSKGAPPPIEVHHFQPVVWENRIHMVGAMTGRYPREQAIDRILTYDPAENSWSFGSVIPPERRRGSAGAVIDGDLLYLISGIRNGHTDGWVAWCDTYNFKTKKWSILAAAPRPRDHFEAAIINGRIYAAGGRRSSAVTNQVFELTIPQVDVYDIAKGTWSTLPSSSNLPVPRAGTATLAVGSELIVFGGESGLQKLAHAEVHALDTSTGKWRNLPSYLQGRHGTTVVAYQGVFYVTAGSGERGGSPLLSTTEMLKFADASLSW